jgi:hypothetical protein
MGSIRNRQGGASMSGILVLLVVGGLLVTAALRLVPHYLEFFTIRSAMDELAADPEAPAMRRAEVLERIDKKLYVNDVDAVRRNDFSFKEVPGATEFSVEYEVRQPLFGNLDAMITFSHSVKIDN